MPRFAGPNGFPIDIPYIYAHAAKPGGWPCDATANENMLVRVPLPPLPFGSNGGAVVLTTWSHTNSANNKTLRIRWPNDAGHGFLSKVNTASTGDQCFTWISSVESPNVQMGFNGNNNGFATTTGAMVAGTGNSEVATNIVITGQKANAGESLILLRYAVLLLPVYPG